MAKFYELHIDNGQEPATALRGAQAWLQRATPSEILAYIGDAAGNGLIDETSAKKIDLSVRRGRSDNPQFAQGWDIIHQGTPEAAPSVAHQSNGPFSARTIGPGSTMLAIEAHIDRARTNVGRSTA
jgi:hypothetical protein